MDEVSAIARAVLYEGYILWPYRRSAIKNHGRWTFGGVYPREHSRDHPDDPWRLHAECVIAGAPEARLEVSVRFLHAVDRRVARPGTDGLRYVDELVLGGRRHLSWQEATEREVRLSGSSLAELTAPAWRPIEIRGAQRIEWLAHGGNSRAAALVRRWHGLEGELEVRSVRIGSDLFRVELEIRNTTAWPGGDRAAAVERAFLSTHAVLRARDGAFVSMTEPPEALRESVEACRNEGVWPVLVGPAGTRNAMLCSPIILYDHPRVAPESPGDLFDGTEIDELLTLSILGLTDDEKEEMRATDPRAREILERTAALPPERLMRLHGTYREMRPTDE